MNDGIAVIMAGLAVAGMIVPVMQTRGFVAKARESMRIEKSEVSGTLRWIIASGLWFGIFLALSIILIVMGNQDVTIPPWGIAAMLLGITILGTSLIVGGFLLELVQLVVFTLPSMREQAEKSSSEDAMSESDP